LIVIGSKSFVYVKSSVECSLISAKTLFCLYNTRVLRYYFECHIRMACHATFS